MVIALIYEKNSQILKIMETYNSRNKKTDGYGGLVGHIIELKNTYYLVPCIGCMHMLNILHCLHNKYKVDTFIRIGSCGIFNSKNELGSVYVIQESINKDALSDKFFPKVSPLADHDLFNYIIKGTGLIAKNTFTIDVVWQNADKTAESIDMETSALYCYAAHNMLHALSISVARDINNKRIDNTQLDNTILCTTKKIISLMEDYY